MSGARKSVTRSFSIARKKLSARALGELRIVSSDAMVRGTILSITLGCHYLYDKPFKEDFLWQTN